MIWRKCFSVRYFVYRAQGVWIPLRTRTAGAATCRIDTFVEAVEWMLRGDNGKIYVRSRNTLELSGVAGLSLLLLCSARVCAVHGTVNWDTAAASSTRLNRTRQYRRLTNRNCERKNNDYEKPESGKSVKAAGCCTCSLCWEICAVLWGRRLWWIVKSVWMDIRNWHAKKRWMWTKIDCEMVKSSLIVAAVTECIRWTASRRSRTDAEASSSDGRRQCQERVRRILVRLAHLSTDDTAC